MNHDKHTHETFNEIVIIDQRDDNPEYTDYPAPIHVYESGHDTSSDVKVNAANFGNHGYSIQISQGVKTSDDDTKVRFLEFAFMNMKEVRRLARLLGSTADYIGRNWEND